MHTVIDICKFNDGKSANFACFNICFLPKTH